MIPIERFTAWCDSLIQAVNSERQQIDGLVMAVKEEHLIKKLKDLKGVQLCVQFPDAVGSGEQDNETDVHDIFFFLVQKMPAGSMSNDLELARYADLQTTMVELRDEIRRCVACGCAVTVPGNQYRIEWEYQIFGGFNGISLGFKLEDLCYD